MRKMLQCGLPQFAFRMKANLTFLLLMLVAVSVGAKVPGKGTGGSFTIINKSGAAVFVKVYASEPNSCTQKYSSAPMSIAAHSQQSFGSQQEMKWLNQTPQAGVHYLSMSCDYLSASGSCHSPASDVIGDEQCKFAKTAVIANKCELGTTLHITWTSNEGNVTVTIE